MRQSLTQEVKDRTSAINELSSSLKEIASRIEKEGRVRETADVTLSRGVSDCKELIEQEARARELLDSRVQSSAQASDSTLKTLHQQLVEEVENRDRSLKATN